MYRALEYEVYGRNMETSFDCFSSLVVLCMMDESYQWDGQLKLDRLRASDLAS